MTTPGSNNHIGNITDIKATAEFRVQLNLVVGITEEPMVKRRRRTHPKLHVI